jgi:hypothetical protein
MVMAKVPAKKSTFVKASGFLKKHWWKTGISLLFLFGLVSFGYEKYLDRQNVTDMKQLLADFEKLKTDVEAETGEELYIEASCGSVGKFATSYGCTLYMKPVSHTFTDTLGSSIKETRSEFLNNHGCILASEGYKIKKESDNYFICSGFNVRSSNTTSAETIFYRYDTSPGSAI